MPRLIDLSLWPQQAFDEHALRKAAARKLRLHPKGVALLMRVVGK